MAKVKFVANRQGLAALLRSDQVGQALEDAARQAAPPGTVVSRVVGRTRQNVRIADESGHAVDKEAKSGHLTRALGQIHI